MRLTPLIGRTASACWRRLGVLVALGISLSASASSFVGIDASTIDRLRDPHYASALSAPSLSAKQVVRIGVPEVLMQGANKGWLEATITHLREALKPARVEILMLSDRDLRTRIRTHHTDFFIANADLLLSLDRTTQFEPMSTLWPSTITNPEQTFASTLFVQKSPSMIHAPSLLDVSGAHFYATDPLSLSGWLAAEEMLTQKLGVNDGKWLDQTTFGDRNPMSVIAALRRHPQSVGVLPACALEDLAKKGEISLSDYYIINAQPTNVLHCAHSTRAYPGWTFGTVKGVKPEVKKAVASALFMMSRARYGVEWVLPVSSDSVKDLFEDLRLGPWANSQTVTVERTLRDHIEIILLLCLAVLMIVLYAATISWVVRKKTRELTLALEDRKRVEQEVYKSRQHISNLERVGIVGQMSTLIAHELKQPLGAVTNYGNGLLRRIRRGAIDPERFEQILEEIVTQAGRASEIVDRVRAYAKQDNPPRSVTDITEVIVSAIQTFRRSRTTNAEVVVRMREHCWAEIDSWGIELAILNLLKNAADALTQTAFPRIEITVRPDDEDNWKITVGDNGPYLTDEQLARFFQPLQTSKGNKGMGLGLSIVASIAEQHAGSITVARNGERGVIFTILIPRLKRLGLEEPSAQEDETEVVTIYRGDPDSPVIHHAERLVGPARGHDLISAFQNADGVLKGQNDNVPASMRGTFDSAVRLMEGQNETGEIEKINRFMNTVKVHQVYDDLTRSEAQALKDEEEAEKKRASAPEASAPTIPTAANGPHGAIHPRVNTDGASTPEMALKGGNVSGVKTPTSSSTTRVKNPYPSATSSVTASEHVHRALPIHSSHTGVKATDTDEAWFKEDIPFNV